MADRHGEDPIAPRRSLGGPILPPPPPGLAEERARKEAEETAKQEKKAQAEARKREAAQRAAQKAEEKRAARKAAADKKAAARKAAESKASTQPRQGDDRGRQTPTARPSQEPAGPPSAPRARATPSPARTGPGPSAPTWGSPQGPRSAPSATSVHAPIPSQRRRRARLRLVHVDAWSVMKTAFLLSIALGIVLVVAVAVVWSVLGSAGVWDSINSTVQQAIGSDNNASFDIRDYLGTSRVVGFTMIVAVIDVILITAIATLGAFLYNLAAALLGGVEVTLTEDH